MSKLADRMYSKYTGIAVSKVAFNLDKEQYDKFANILWQLIEAFKSCSATPEVAVTVSKKPKATDVAQVKRAVKKELGFFKNLFQGSKYVQAVLDAGKETTLDEVKEVWRG